MLWDRCYWAPEKASRTRPRPGQGELKFRLEGERMHGSGSWCASKDSPAVEAALALIKHRDECGVRHTPPATVLMLSRLGAHHDEIAHGKVRKAKPFMPAQGAGAPARSGTRSRRASSLLRHLPSNCNGGGQVQGRATLPLHRAAATTPEEASRTFRMGAEISSTATAMQFADRRRPSDCAEPSRAWDWSPMFPEIVLRRLQTGCTAAWMPRSWRWIIPGAPDVATLQARDLQGEPKVARFLRFDLNVARQGRPQALPPWERKQRLQAHSNASPTSATSTTSSRRVWGWGGGAGPPLVLSEWIVEGIVSHLPWRPLSIRPRRERANPMPVRARGWGAWLDHTARHSGHLSRRRLSRLGPGPTWVLNRRRFGRDVVSLLFPPR